MQLQYQLLRVWFSAFEIFVLPVVAFSKEPPTIQVVEDIAQPESERTIYVRSQADLLFDQLESDDAQVAAKAIGYLTHLAIEFPDLSIVPTASSSNGSPVSAQLSSKARQQIQFYLDDPSSLKRGAAVASLNVLISKSSNLKPLLDLFQDSYCECEHRLDVQLAILDGLNDRLKADQASFANFAASTKKKRDDKQAEIAATLATIDSIEKQLSDVYAKASGLRPKVPSNVNPPVPGSPVPDPHLDNLTTRTAAVWKLKLQGLLDALDALHAASDKLNKELSDISPPAIAPSRISTLDTIDSFIEKTRTCNQSIIVQSIVASIEYHSRRLRIDYSGIKAFGQADAFFASVPSSGTAPEASIGASTSAADKPGVSESFTSTDRAGVSSTAPFDPNVRLQARPIYPLTDDTGKRLKRDTSKDVNNTFHKPPGATGATKPK